MSTPRLAEDATAPAAPSQRLTPKGRATRARIIAAAAALIYERGVANTTTDDVRAAANVSTSQIYHYFHDKDALVQAVIAHQSQTVLDSQDPWLGQLDSIDALRAWRNLLVDQQRQRHSRGGCPIGSLASELAETNEPARTALTVEFERWEAPIRAGLQAMHKRGDLLPEANPDQLALAILAAVQGGILLTQTRRDTAPLEAALDCILELLQTLHSTTTKRPPLTIRNVAGTAPVRTADR